MHIPEQALKASKGSCSLLSHSVRTPFESILAGAEAAQGPFLPRVVVQGKLLWLNPRPDQTTVSGTQFPGVIRLASFAYLQKLIRESQI